MRIRGTLRRTGLRAGIALGAMAVVLALPGSALAAPTATTTDATQITDTSAVLNGFVEPNGQVTSWHFDYATDAYYTANGGTYSDATSERPVAFNAVPIPVLVTAVGRRVTGLTPNTTYHFRLVATSNQCFGTPLQNSCPVPPETDAGDDVTFTTLP